MEKTTISEAFGTQAEETGWFVDKVVPAECHKIRVSMGEAVQNEISDRINDLNIDDIRSQIARINLKHPTSEDALERKIMRALQQKISDFTTEFSKPSTTPLEGTLKNLFDEHLKIIQEECDKQKNNIAEFLQQDRLLKRMEQQEKRLSKIKLLLIAQFCLLVLMAFFYVFNP
jgi:hypothetical protein